MSLRWMTPSDAAVPFGDDERRAAASGDAVDDRVQSSSGRVAALLLDPAAHRVGRALADADRPVARRRRYMRVWAVNGDELGVRQRRAARRP